MRARPTRRWYEILRDGFAAAEEVVLLVQVGAILFLVSLQVVSRYLLASLLATDWTEELARIMLLWLILVGSFQLLRRGEHLSVHLLLGLFKGRIEVAGKLMSSIIVIFVIIFVLQVAFPLANSSLRELTTALQWPRLVVYGPFVVFMGMMLVLTLKSSIMDARRLLQRG